MVIFIMEHNPFATPDFLLIFLLNLKLFQQSENVLDQQKRSKMDTSNLEQKCWHFQCK